MSDETERLSGPRDGTRPLAVAPRTGLGAVAGSGLWLAGLIALIAIAALVFAVPLAREGGPASPSPFASPSSSPSGSPTAPPSATQQRTATPAPSPSPTAAATPAPTPPPLPTLTLAPTPAPTPPLPSPTRP